MIETFPSGLYTWPDDRCMLIVAPEYTTLVRVDAPNQPIDVAPSPVTSLHPLVDRGLVLLCGEAHIAAFDSSGLRWSSARIAWDGLDIDRIEGDAAIGTACNPVSEDGTAFSVDLRTGAHEGSS